MYKFPIQIENSSRETPPLSDSLTSMTSRTRPTAPMSDPSSHRRGAARGTPGALPTGHARRRSRGGWGGAARGGRRWRLSPSDWAWPPTGPGRTVWGGVEGAAVVAVVAWRVGWSGPGRAAGVALAVGGSVAAGRTGPDRVGSRARRSGAAARAALARGRGPSSGRRRLEGAGRDRPAASDRGSGLWVSGSQVSRTSAISRTARVWNGGRPPLGPSAGYCPDCCGFKR